MAAATSWGYSVISLRAGEEKGKIRSGRSLPIDADPLAHCGKFWDLSTRGGDNILWPPRSTPLGAPPHELGLMSSMPGPMRMKLPTVVQYH